jgi:hypothetical protein
MLAQKPSTHDFSIFVCDSKGFTFLGTKRNGSENAQIPLTALRTTRVFNVMPFGTPTLCVSFFTFHRVPQGL